MTFFRIMFLGFGLCIGVSSAQAADRALGDCAGGPTADRVIKGCTQVLRRNLPVRGRSLVLQTRGFVYLNQSNLDLAMADFEDEIRLEPGFTGGYYGRGMGYIAKNDADRALSDFSRALQIDPNYAGAYNGRGMALRQKGDIEHALADFVEAERINPGLVQAYANEAQTLLDKGSKDGALARIDAAIQANPRDQQLPRFRQALLAEVANGAGNGQAAAKPTADAIPAEILTLYQQITDLRSARKYEEAYQLVQAYVDRARQVFGPETPRYASTLDVKGDLEELTGRFPDAAKTVQTAIEITERVLGADDEHVVYLQSNLARIDLNLHRNDEAEALDRRVLAFREKKLGPDDLEVATALNGIALALSDKAQFPEAERLTKRALSIRERKLGVDDSATLQLLGNLGTIYEREDRVGEAQQIYEQVVATEEKAGRSGLNMANSLGNLADLYIAVGRYDDAEKITKRAIAIFEKLTGAGNKTIVHGLTRLGVIYSIERRDFEAETVLKRALVILERTFGPDNAELVAPLGNLGNVLRSESRTAEAEQLLSRCVAIDEKAFGPDHPNLAVSLQDLALALSAEGRGTEAIQALQRALKIEEKAYGPDSPQLASTLSNLGLEFEDSGHAEEAQAQFKRALKNANNAASPDPRTLADILGNQAGLFLSSGQGAAAIGPASQSLALLQTTFGPDHPQIAHAQTTLAEAAVLQGNWVQALDRYRQGALVAGHNADRVAGPIEPGSDVHLALAVISRGVIEAAWHVADQDPSRRAALADEAFSAAQGAQLGSAAAALSQMAARFASGSSAVSAVVREEQDLSAQAEALDKLINTSLGTPAEKRNEAALAQLRTQSADTESRLEAIDARIAREFPNYAELSHPKPLRIADVQRLLKPDEALVSWCILGDDAYVWAMTNERSAWQRIDLSEKQLNEIVQKMRASLDLSKVTGAIGEGAAGRDIVFDLNAANALYAKILEPVQDILVGKTDLIVVPDGALTSLPLQVLVTDAPKRGGTSITDPIYKNAAWLARRFAIIVMPSVPALRALRSLPKPSQAQKPLIGFADPVFQRVAANSGTRQLAATGAKVNAYSSYFRGGEVDIDALRKGLPALPETADELREVAKQLSAPSDDLKFGDAATVTSVMSLPLDQYRVVYFATHGLVAGDVTGLTEPALALSLPDHPTEADSGLLTASDVSQLKLDADWVVLSACNTAVGDKPGAEGLSGLARAFFYAGARALLVSHWPVQSEAAVELTTQTFAALAADKHLGRAEALQRSMLALIDRGEGFAYPAVWAPFVVVGEGAQ